MSKLKQWLAEEAYQDMRFLIFSLVKKFHTKFGGDFEELVGEALFLFIKANHEFDHELETRFSTLVQNKIWFGLIDANKKRWRTGVPDSLDYAIEQGLEFYQNTNFQFMVDLFDEISEDAQFVVKCVLEPNKKLHYFLMRNYGLRLERRCLRKYLKKYHQWTDQRVTNSFYEIAYAIRS